jgi:hypothetical protein
MCEYMLIAKTDGFSPYHNPSDAIFLDDIMFLGFTAAEKEELISQQYYGYAWPFLSRRFPTEIECGEQQ